MTLMTGGVVAYGLALWEHLKGKSVPASVWVILGTALFVIACFIAWDKERQKYETEAAKHEVPNLNMELPNIIWSYDSALNLTTVCISVVLTNSGSPTCATRWGARYQSPLVDMTVTSVNMPTDEIEWPEIGGYILLLRKQDLMPVQTMNLIQRGESKFGRVVFEFMGDHRAELTNRAARIWVGCYDATGRLCQQFIDPAYIQTTLFTFPNETARLAPLAGVDFMLPESE